MEQRIVEETSESEMQICIQINNFTLTIIPCYVFHSTILAYLGLCFNLNFNANIQTVSHKYTFLGNRDIINITADGDYVLHDRINDWVDINKSDMKIFLGHLILMGIVKKSQIAKYWAKGGMTETPYFGQTMTQNQFLLVMKDLHIVNNLFDEKQMNYSKYTLSLPCVKITLSTHTHVILQFQLMRHVVVSVEKFHMKLYQLCEAKSGYAAAFKIYTDSESVNISKVLDPKVSKTCELVMGLMEKCGMLDKGYQVYFDNYYTSMELMEELGARYTFACGTLHSNRQGLPAAVTKAKLKKRRNCVSA